MDVIRIFPIVIYYSYSDEINHNKVCNLPWRFERIVDLIYKNDWNINFKNNIKTWYDTVMIVNDKWYLVQELQFYLMHIN